MITKFILNFSLFVSFFTLIYCMINGVSVNESIFRGLIVFAGFYVILTLFFIVLRIILRPTAQPMSLTSERTATTTEEDVSGE